MYDVIYMDLNSRARVLATGLSRASATGMARVEARRRHAGRMFLAGSETAQSHAVLIIRSDT